MALWENVIGYGPHADRPAPGAPGALYCESDTGEVWRDTGLTWQEIADVAPAPTPVPLTVLPVSSDTALGGAHVFVVVSGIHTITLPDATMCAGQQVVIKSATGDSFSVLNSDTTAANGDGQCPWNGYSDGTQFWNVDF